MRQKGQGEKLDFEYTLFRGFALEHVSDKIIEHISLKSNL